MSGAFLHIRPGRWALVGGALVLAAWCFAHWRQERHVDAAIDALNRGQAIAAIAHAKQASGRSTAVRADRAEALAALALGHLRLAEQRITAAILASPSDWELHVAYAAMLLRGGNVAGAKAELRTARKLNPRMPLSPSLEH